MIKSLRIVLGGLALVGLLAVGTLNALSQDKTTVEKAKVDGGTIKIGALFAVTGPAAPLGGPEAKTLRGTAQKALAGEIDARAARLAGAADDAFVLASDSVIRWTGAPVGKLIPGDDVLHPRVRIIADEQLTGASRDGVQARVDLWLKTHVEKLLAPVFALAKAEDVTGIARGIAFQLTEAIGVIERQRVAEDVKGLDQEARASLRKYGVRFGAYHIYLPALLKPAPRALALQLWALKHGNGELKGVDEARSLAASGRTSFPVDKDADKTMYRTVGYRVCGERAVRVDILERLADLIRPALAWREGSATPKPAGALDGRAFTVTGAMTSLTGSSGEDFASILRSLGYRMEKRPKPPEPTSAEAAPAAPTPVVAAPEGEANAAANGHDAAALVIDAAPAEAPAATEAESAAVASEPLVVEAIAATVPETGGDSAAGDEAAEPVEAPAEATLDDVARAIAAMQAETPAAEVVAPAADIVAPVADVVAPVADVAAPPEASANAEPAGAAPAAEATPAAEPEMIEVWRPGRPPEERHRPPRRASRSENRGEQGGEHQGEARGGYRGRRGPRPQPQAGTPDAATPDAAAPIAASGEAPAATPASTESRAPRGDRRPRHERPQQGRSDRPEGERRADRPERQGRPPERKDRPDRGPPRGREDRGRGAFGKDRNADRGEPREWRDPKERRGREPDPNSPFAKLAALKEQLEANAKERH